MVLDDKFPIAAQLFIRLKRTPGRVIDVTWMLENETYALEVLRVAKSADAESAELAKRYESMLKSTPRPSAVAAAQASFNRTGVFQVPVEEAEVPAPEVGRHYVGHLR